LARKPPDSVHLSSGAAKMLGTIGGGEAISSMKNGVME
jgi:hypothetical protein